MSLLTSSSGPLPQSKVAPPLPFGVLVIRLLLRKIRTSPAKGLEEPWPGLAHAERVISHQLCQLPGEWSKERQELADRLYRLLLLRLAQARIFADPASLSSCPAILAAIERLSGPSLAAGSEPLDILALAR
ncbi:MAG: hypothetical protein K0041_00645 [Acidithiobacillus sp.]|nr:hypothetical protein [Acidithiobacillus sp.]